MPARADILGDEEIEVIEPVLQRLRARGHESDRPAAGRYLFQKQESGAADAVLAMYHDQGLPVLKHASFGEGVNITLGLPIIRTSVDHGTALDLAGTGRIDAGSLQWWPSRRPGRWRARSGLNRNPCRLSVAESQEGAGPAFSGRYPLHRAHRRGDPARGGDRMVEIGPGPGALTRPLLEIAAHLDVVEIDRDMVARLQAEFPPSDLRSMPSMRCLRLRRLGSELRVVGNLPYNISSPLLFHLAESAAAIIDMTFMLQKEVVDRMAAAPDTPDYGRLSVMLQARFKVSKLFTVPPGAFQPPPKVDSAIVRLVPLPPDAIAVS
jgi:hypothetical protein